MSQSTAERFAPAARRRALAGGRNLLLSLLCAVLVARVLIDDLASPDSRHSGSLDLSGAVAVLLVLLACVLLLRRRQRLAAAALAALWLCVWTVLAVSTRGASTETLREGMREGSVVALAVIVLNARATITAGVAARVVQIMGLVPAVIAVYQLAAHTGMEIGGHIRSNGTFAHPDSAAMFFALSAVASLWLHLDGGRRRVDLALMSLYAVAALATLSIDGVATLIAMLVALGLLRAGSLRERAVPWAIAGVLGVAFLATPAGAQRVAKQSATKLAGVERGEVNSSLGWRLHKWETLLPEWERSPLLGRGLGTTTTMRGAPGDRYTSKPPHNEYVRYLVETGIIGLVILLCALAVLIHTLTRRRRSEAAIGSGACNAAAFALAVLVGCLLNAAADNTFLNSPTCYAVALLLFAVLSMTSGEARRDAAL